MGTACRHRVLIDLGGTFVPEPGHETFRGVSVRETLTAFIHALRPTSWGWRRKMMRGPGARLIFWN